MKLKNKIAVVTGASRGIGKAIALAIAENGGQTALVARTESGLLETQKMIYDMGGKAEIFPADLGDQKAVLNTAENILNTYGQVDILVNNAGIWYSGDQVWFGTHLQDTPINQIQAVIDVDILAPILLTRCFLPGMIRQKKGKVLNISGYPGGASEAKGSIHEYVAKKAIEHFTAGLAEEVREHNIQVNCLSPILVATESLHRFFPEEVKDAILPEEIAKLSVFFLSEESDRVTGQIIVAGK